MAFKKPFFCQVRAKIIFSVRIINLALISICPKVSLTATDQTKTLPGIAYPLAIDHGAYRKKLLLYPGGTQLQSEYEGMGEGQNRMLGGIMSVGR